jgi:hypothetical protein
MKLLLRLLIIALIAFFTMHCDGGSKVSTANYDKIEEGMSLTKVKGILGEPTKLGGSASSLGTEAIWEGQQASIIVRFVDEKVDSKEFKKK